MNIKDIFSSKSLEAKKTRIAFLAGMMTADGKIDEKEQAFLRRKAIKIGLSSDEVKKIINDSLFGNFEPEVPEDPEERYTLLIDLVIMMLIDGHIDDKEMDLCRSKCVSLGFSENIIPIMIDIITQANDKGLSYNECIKLLDDMVEDN